MSHTFAVLDISPQAFAEIKRKLIIAGYDHSIQQLDASEVIDMHGIALASEDPPERALAAQLEGR